MKLSVYIGLIISIGVYSDDSQHCSQPSFNKLLSRKKRFLTFPDGSSFAVKRSFSKAIIDNIPRGIIINLDCGIFYPLPGSKDPWNPAKLLYRLDLARTGGLSATEKPKSKVDVLVDTKNDSIGVLDAAHIHPDMLFPSTYRWKDNRKSSWRRKDYYTAGPTFTRNNLKGRTRPNYNTITKHLNRFSTSGNATGLRFETHKNVKHFENVPWLHHREFRERREAYAHSEGLGYIFGINMKACIMRAICEMNNDLLPPGKSFIQDVARIFFELPTDHDFEDDYGNIAKEKNLNCAKRFLFSCPHSPIEFIMRVVRLIGVKESVAIKDPIVFV